MKHLVGSSLSFLFCLRASFPLLPRAATHFALERLQKLIDKQNRKDSKLFAQLHLVLKINLEKVCKFVLTLNTNGSMQQLPEIHKRVHKPFV